MDEKKLKEHCSHNYEYSHKEYKQIEATMATREIDVVVCTKCGNVKRN